MATFYIFVLATVICSVQSLPVETTKSSSSSSSSGLQLFVKNTTDSTSTNNSYHLTPFISELEQIDEEITEELDAILPYLSFLFDTLLNRSSDETDECVDDLVIQLVPEKNLKSQPKTDEDKAAEPVVEA